MQVGTSIESSDLSSDLGSASRNRFETTWARLLSVLDTPTDACLASVLGITQQSVAGSKRKRRIPPGWITAMALERGVSADWLLLGEGKMLRGEAGAEGPLLVQERPAPIYKVMKHEQADEKEQPSGGKNIADLVSKTIEVLQSQTVFETALTSNIEAFHHAIDLEKKIDGVEDRIMRKVSSRLDGLENANKKLGQENQQLREDIRHDRDQEPADDTG